MIVVHASSLGNRFENRHSIIQDGARLGIVAVGSPARFQPRDSREDLPGRITRSTGPSASPANLAIQPSAPMRESYHVTVAVPKLAEGYGCMVGRPGHVFFNDGPMEAMAALAPAAP